MFTRLLVFFALAFVAVDAHLQDGDSSKNLRRTTTDSHSYPNVIERLDYWTATSQPQSRVLQLVEHRELFIGCTTFEEYLSPMFITLIVLPRDIAYALNVDKIQADSSITAGLHILFTNNTGVAGSHYARNIAEQFISNELEPLGIEIRYMHSINCDVHEFPANHSKYVSTEYQTLRMERDFDLAKQHRRVGRNIATNYDSTGYPWDSYTDRCTHGCTDPIPMADMKIFAMNTILFEDVPLDNETNELGHFHGNDVGHWWYGGGWDSKPQALVNACLPWLTDVSGVFEDHAVMIDLEALRSVKDEYFGVSPRAFPDANYFLGPFARKNNFTLLRHNDVAFHVNFGHDSAYLNYPPNLDVNWFKMRNLEEMVEHRNPEAWQANWDRALSIAGIEEAHDPWTPFFFRHIHKESWLPASLDRSQVVTDETVLGILKSVFRYCGYEMTEIVNGMLRFELGRVYPGTRLIAFNEDHGDNKRFLTLKLPNSSSITLYIDGWKVGSPPPETTHTLEIPVNATLHRNDFHIKN